MLEKNQKQKVIALDTEFERTHTYHPILSIVQVKEEDDEEKIYDVFKVDNSKLEYLINLLADNSVVKVIHASKQDIEAIFYRFHIELKNVFDTQVGAHCLGYENEIGYARLVKTFLNKEIIKEKKLQKSRWLDRPLTENQIKYAKQDVAYLIDIYYKMTERFEVDKSAFENFKNSMKILENPDNYKFNPLIYWEHIRHKIGFMNNIKIAKELFILREKIANNINVCRERVITTENLKSFANSGDVSFLQVHWKVDKKEFIKTFQKLTNN